MNWMKWADKEGRAITFQAVDSNDNGRVPGEPAKPYQATVRAFIDNVAAGEIHATARGETYEEAADEAILKLRQQVLAAVE